MNEQTTLPIRKVGQWYRKEQRKKYSLFRYSDVKTDFDGWADAAQYLPIDYDLVLLKIKGKKPIPGWHNVNTWDGLKLCKNDVVKYWKKLPYEKVES